MFIKPKVALGLTALAIVATSCTQPDSKPEKVVIAASAGPQQNSPAYQYALDRAFADLAQRKNQERAPAAAGGHHLDAKKVKGFTVFVYPKFRALNDQRQPAERPIHLGDESEFYVAVFTSGNCATGAEVVPASARQGCVTVEMRPKSHAPVKRPRDIVRVYMDADYHAYGMSYYDADASGALSTIRKRVKLNPQEPLSSELLSASREVAPIDLPVNASNAVKENDGSVDFTSDLGPLLASLKSRSSFARTRVSRDKLNCNGTSTSYKNTYGSSVRVVWCEGDPWPTAVETDRYLALLAP